MIFIFSLICSLAFAHSGGTDAYGCHAGSRPYHCHGGGSGAASFNSSSAYNFLYNPKTPKAICRDGTISYSKTNSGTCAHHGGVYQWLDGKKHSKKTTGNSLQTPLERASSTRRDKSKEAELRRAIEGMQRREAYSVPIGTLLQQDRFYRYGYEVVGYTKRGMPEFVYVLKGRKRYGTPMTKAMQREAWELWQQEARRRGR